MSKYLDWIFSSSRSKNAKIVEEVGTGFFQSAKDWTECVGVITVLFDYCKRKNLNIHKMRGTAYVIGDGADPQTGYLLARRVAPCFKVHSVDPRLREEYFASSKTVSQKKVNKLLPNMILERKKVEQVVPTVGSEIYFIIGVHNHGPIQTLYETLSKQARTIVISLPCCTKDANLSMRPTEFGVDIQIISAMNVWYLWDSEQVGSTMQAGLLGEHSDKPAKRVRLNEVGV